MPLKQGYSDQTIRTNIRRELAQGRGARQAIAMSYDQARLSALASGHIERFNELVGVDLPPDIMAMTETQAFAELSDIDSLALARQLTPDEFKRLTDLELRLEQFAADEVEKAADIEIRARRGEDVFGHPALPGAVTEEVTPGAIAARGTRNPWPFVLGGLALAVNALS